MSDPATLGLASTAVGLVNGTISLLKEARAAARTSEDHELKDMLSEVFDSVLELKEVVSSLREENAELQRRLDARARLTWNSSRKLYFADGDPDPFCPSCFDLKGQQIRLQPHKYSLLHQYQCPVCEHEFLPRD
jgi:hypothetical protein